MSKTILDCLPAEDIIFNPHFFLLILLLPIISRISVWSLLILMVREKKGSGWKNLTLTHKIHKHIKVSKERYLLEQDKTSKFWGISITKWHKQQLNCQKQWKIKWKAKPLICFWSSHCLPVQCLEEFDRSAVKCCFVAWHNDKGVYSENWLVLSCLNKQLSFKPFMCPPPHPTPPPTP